MKTSLVSLGLGCLLAVTGARGLELDLRNEQFENGSGGSLVNTLPGWSGDGNVLISSTTIADGQSVNWMGGASPAWPTVIRNFSGTPSIRDTYTLTATLHAPDTTGSYACLSLRNSTDHSQEVRVDLGHNVLDFTVLGTASGGSALRNSQLTVPVDVMLVVTSTDAQFYYKAHTSSTWIDGGLITIGNPLYLYDEIVLGGKGNYPGAIDAVQLVASNRYMDDGFEKGTPGQPVILTDGWTGDTTILTSSATIDQGFSANWMGGASPVWPSIYKKFYNDPAPGDVYTLTATLSAPNITGAFAMLSLQNSADPSKSVQAVLGYNKLYFYMLGTASGGFERTNPQSLAPVDIKMVVSGSSANFYYRENGTSTWTSGGTVSYGNPMSTYDEISVSGHGNYGGSIDSIQLSTGEQPINRGRQVLLNRGLQIQSLVFVRDAPISNITQWNGTKFTTMNFWGEANSTILPIMTAGTPWSRMYHLEDPSSQMLKSHELPYENDLVSLQYDDELPDGLEPTRQVDMFDTFREWNISYPDTIAYTNFAGYDSWPHMNTLEMLLSFTQATQPDMLMFDAYPPFTFPELGVEYYFGRNNWYKFMQIYRTAALGGYDGSGMRPLPYGQYLNLFRSNYSTDSIPSESFVRLQQFASWTFGYTFASAFIYNGVSTESSLQSVMFSGAGDSSPTQVLGYVTTANTQSRNLGPTLIRLRSTDIRMIKGTAYATLPTGISSWSVGAGDCPYITSIEPRGAANTASPAQHADWLIGYFRPLKMENDDYPYANGKHFMITNGSPGTPTLPSDPGDPASASAEWVRIHFDFTGTSYTGLQRMSRTTGLPEVVTLTPNGTNQYYLDLQLDGGTGDIFRFYPH